MLINYFNYNLNYGGGIFYKTSLIIFKNNYFFYFLSLIGFNVLFSTLFLNFNNKDKISDFILFVVLILLEIDVIFYHETYDPLLYFIFFLLVKSKFYVNFSEKFTVNKLILISLFSMSFFVLSVLRSMQ